MQAVWLFFPAILLAQDTRNVTEPAIPPVCATLSASLSAPLKDTDETKLDSGRIQTAIDQCAKGQAVQLKADGSSNAFLSGALQLRSGVTLWIDRGGTLFGWRHHHYFY